MEILDGTDDGIYAVRYAVPISDTQELRVEVELTGEQVGSGGRYRVIRWQTVPSAAWEGDESLGLWDGTL